MELADVKVSPDRRVLTVTTFYPVALFCGKRPGGVTVEVRGTVAIVSAYVREIRGQDCSTECSTVVQMVTLADPLPAGTTFEAPTGALRGCGTTLPPPA